MSLHSRDRKRFPAALPGTVLALILLLPPAGAWAGPAIVGAPSVVRPGQLVEISWRAPAGAEELELLLVLAADSRESLRLTESLSARSGTWRWRVPSLPAATARLVLRWGCEGREMEGEPGPSFTIALPGARLAPITLRRGELWVGWGSAPGISATGLSSAAHASWPLGRTAPATLPRQPMRALIPSFFCENAPDAAEAVSGPAPRRLDLSPSSIPLRE